MATDTQSTQPQLVKRNDAYTGLLAISFLAMVGGCVLLYLEYQQYENRVPPAMPKIDVPGTLRPAPTPPKDAPKEKAKDAENPDPVPMPMPEKEKDKVRNQAAPSMDALVIPIPEPAALPSAKPTTSARVGGSAKTSDLIIPASAKEPQELFATPIIPAIGTEPTSSKIPATTLPTASEPNLEEAPPLKVKPFIPPM